MAAEIIVPLASAGIHLHLNSEVLGVRNLHFITFWLVHLVEVVGSVLRALEVGASKLNIDIGVCRSFGSEGVVEVELQLFLYFCLCELGALESERLENLRSLNYAFIFLH